MKRFIKHNLVFLIVLALALTAAIGLMVMVIMEHSRMSNHYKRALDLKEQIGKLIEQRDPAPVAGNVEPINREIGLYREKTEEVRRYFTGVKQPALEAFAKVLGVSYPEFSRQFREAWEADSNRHALGGRDRFYQNFRRRHKRWDQALQAFVTEYQKITVEPITASNRDEILLWALGVPRNMDSDLRNALNYIGRMRTVMTGLFDAQQPDVELTGSAAYFSFENFQQSPPPPEEIPHIVRQWEVIGDLGTRIAKSGIKSLYQFQKRSLGGERAGDYVVYHYTIGVSGELDKVRKLVADLHDAVKDNRFYIVRSVFLYAVRDGAGELLEARRLEDERVQLEAEGAAAASPESAPRGRGRQPDMPPEMGGNASDQAAAEQERQLEEFRRLEMAKPFHERLGYGQILIGGGTSCEAVIDIEYIALAEPELN